MGLGQRLHSGLHGGMHGHAGDHSGDHSGGLIRRARIYEITTAICFGGLRRRVYDGLVELSGATPGDHVLDVGCGPGYLTRRAARAVGPTGRVEGIDPSPEVIAYATRTAPAYATRTAPANATFLVAAAEQLPHPDNTFDVVISSLAIHHIHPDQRPAALREMRRVLRQDGRLLIADFRPPRNKIANRLIGAFCGHAMQHNPIDQLPGLITDAGFLVTGQGDRKHWLRYIQASPRT